MGEDSRDLLHRWYQAEDEVALGLLVEQHRDWLSRYVKGKLGRQLRVFQGSEDVVSDVLLDVLRYDPRFEPRSEEEFRALLARIALNRIARLNDYVRAQRRDMGREQRLDSRTISRIGPAMPAPRGPIVSWRRPRSGGS